MKTLALESDGLTVERLLAEAADGEVVFLTTRGETAFALVKVDDFDRELHALRSNEKFMTYLSECERRARTGRRKRLEDVRRDLEERND